MENMKEEIMPEDQGGEEKIECEEPPKQEIPESQRKIERAKAENLKGRLDVLKEKNRWVMSDRVAAFVNDLRKEYGRDKVVNYILYHILVGSTYDEKDCEFFDFPGENSIEKFVEDLEKEQGGKDKD